LKETLHEFRRACINFISICTNYSLKRELWEPRLTHNLRQNAQVLKTEQAQLYTVKLKESCNKKPFPGILKGTISHPKQQNRFLLSCVSWFRVIPEDLGGLILASLFAANYKKEETIFIFTYLTIYRCL